VVIESSLEQVEPFREKMSSFIDDASKKVNELSELASFVFLNFNKLHFLDLIYSQN